MPAWQAEEAVQATRGGRVYRTGRAREEVGQAGQAGQAEREGRQAGRASRAGRASSQMFVGLRLVTAFSIRVSIDLILKHDLATFGMWTPGVRASCLGGRFGWNVRCL